MQKQNLEGMRFKWSLKSRTRQTGMKRLGSYLSREWKRARARLFL
jgi:hypothetical protein